MAMGLLNHARQTVTFLGATELAGLDGTLLHAGTSQPLFHVHHSIGGTGAVAGSQADCAGYQCCARH
jgi:predicted DNA-binding protein with PD1-like motif